MNRIILALFVITLSACAAKCACNPSPGPAVSDAGSGIDTKAVLSNMTDAGATVNVSFGADSKIGPIAWSSFCSPTPSGCMIALAGSTSQALPMGGQYTNVTFAFNGPVGCGSSLAEFTANNASGYGTADISLVNGWNAKLAIYVNGQTLGPAVNGDNSQVSGVFPVACDVCVARSSPPCGFDAGGCTTSGSCGCKSGTQYNPSAPCQITYQQSDAGSLLNIALLP